MSDISKMNLEPMLEMFVFESNQLLEQLDELLLQSEKSNHITMENINEIFRIMHTVKGSSAMMMFNNISAVGHSVEDLFYYIRENKPDDLNYSAICDIVLIASDFIKSEISNIEAGIGSNRDESELVLRIKNFLARLKNIPLDEVETAPPPPKAEKYYISSYNAPIIEFKALFRGKVYFDEGCQMENIRAYTIVHNLKDISTDITHIPANVIEDSTSSEYIIQNGFEVYFRTSASFDEIDAIFKEAIFVKSYELKEIDEMDEGFQSFVTNQEKPKEIKEVICTPERQIIEPEESIDAGSKGVKQNILSVNIAKLDKLMDLVGEIVITESMVTRNQDLNGLQLENFAKAARQLRKLNDELQDIVMSIRMVPIESTFRKMFRIVRDMSKRLGKEAELEIIGEDTEVDKNIIDNLSDPLMHLIRNAMDHGLEDFEEREQKNKPAKGTIILEAKNTGGDVTITITDDGRGLDKDKIAKKARENGLITKTDAELTDKEIYSFILLPGFSTKEQVTEFSGRGVGMDVVKKNIEKVGGNISIESTLGVGTTITIKIPLTLAIVDGMQIAVGKSVYTLPTVSIKESFKPDRTELITDPDGNEMIMIRGNCYPVIRLHKLFNVKTNISELNEGIIVVVENDIKTVCLFADALLGEQQVVVKPLPPYLLKYKVKESGVAGCTITGDGSISLILDTLGIINRII